MLDLSMGLRGFVFLILPGFCFCVPVSVFSGSHFRKLEPLAVYEASIPLTYVLPNDQFRLPDLSEFSLPPCPFPDMHLRKMAAAAGEFDRLLVQLQQRELSHQNTSVAGRGRRAITMIGDLLHWCCGTATDTELHALAGNEEAVNKHLNSLQDMMKDDHLDLVKTVGEMKNFSGDVRRVMGKVHAALDVLRSELDQQVPTERVYGVLISHVIHLQAQLYTDQINLVHDKAQLECRGNLLPPALVPEDLLRKDLGELAKNISGDGFEIALPLTNIGVFYGVPITSCKISPSKFVLTIKIPVKRMGDRWTLFEYIPSPMSWRGLTCTMALQPIIVALSGGSVRTVSGLQREDCNPKSTRMCKVPRQMRGSLFSSDCAAKMMGRHTIEDLRGSCPFYCSPSHGGVLVTQVAAESYVITNPSPDMTVKCDNLSLTLPVNVPGAIEITLTCDCVLSVGEVVLISRQYPCFPGTVVPSVVHVLPAAWTSLTNLTFDVFESNSRPVFQNFSNILSSNWTIASPSFMVHQDIPPSLAGHVSLPESWLDIQDLTSLKYILIFGWLGALSVLLGYICFKLCMMNVMLGALKPR